MGQNCCQRAKNPNEIEYGQDFTDIDQSNFCQTVPSKMNLLNKQRNSFHFNEAHQQYFALQMFDPSTHALPVALHHCMQKTCTGLKSTIQEVLKISQHYSSGMTKSYFDVKFLISDYGVLEIQSKGSKCWEPSQLSKQYQIEFQELKKQGILSPYSSTIENLVCIVRKKKQSFAFSIKLNAFNQLTQKPEIVLHTLFPYVSDSDCSISSMTSFSSTQFKGFDCGELSFSTIDEFYEYLDALFEEDEDYSIGGLDTKLSSQKSNDTTNETQDKSENFIFIQLIAFLEISRLSKMSDAQEIEHQQMQSTQSFIDLLNTQQNEESYMEDQEGGENNKNRCSLAFSMDKENQRCSYFSNKSNSRFSHIIPQQDTDILRNSMKLNVITTPPQNIVKKNKDFQIK